MRRRAVFQFPHKSYISATSILKPGFDSAAKVSDQLKCNHAILFAMILLSSSKLKDLIIQT